MAKALKTVGAVVAIAGLAVVTGGAAVGLGVSLATSIGGISAGTLLLAGGALQAIGTSMQKMPDVPASQVDRLNANVDIGAHRKTVLGSTALASDIRYLEWFGNDQERCGWIVAHASHRIHSVDQIWLNDELAWTATGGTQGKFVGYFWVRRVVLEGSAANAFTFGSGKWNSGSSRLTGCAYSHWEFKVTGNGKKAESPFASGIPTRVTVVGKGAPLYDPRRDSTVPGGSGPMRADDQSTWRFIADDGAVIGDNLALQILRVLLGWKINGRLAVGCGVPVRRLGLPSFAVAANQCDEPVGRSAGGTEPRYQGAAVLSEGLDPRPMLDPLLAACSARFRDHGGKLQISIMHNDLAAAATDEGLDEDDVIGAFTWDPDPALEQTPNIIRGRYTNPASLYQLVPYPDVSLPSFDGIDRVLTMDLGVVESASQAQRVIKQFLQRKQYARRFSAPFDITAWRYNVGDVVPLTFAPLSFDRKLFRVVETDPGSNPCQMVLEEESPAIYAWANDDRAPVVAAVTTIYDASNNPLILAINEASETAIWDGVTGPGKPEDGATVGAPPGTEVGGRPVEEIVDWLDQRPSIEQRFQELDDAVANVSSGAVDAAAEYAEAAQLARDQAQAARDASQAAQQQAEDNAAAAAILATSADGFAQTASGQAIIAVQKADEAGQSASTATAQADIATTKAGEASVFRNQAAASESNAAGSASSAATQAGISATARDAATEAALAARPTTFATVSGSPYWTISGGFSGAQDATAGAYVLTHVSAGSSYGTIASRWSVPNTTAKRYRIRARVKSSTAGRILLRVLGAANADVSGAAPYTDATVSIPTANEWVWVESELNAPDAPFVAVAAYPNFPERIAGTSAAIAALEMVDITSEAASRASASAAATSASSAAASNDQAGQRASAAQEARLAAETARGQAETFRGDAATSASNAAGSASSAATSASLSASASAAALMLENNPYFDFGLKSWAANQANADAQIETSSATVRWEASFSGAQNVALAGINGRTDLWSFRKFAVQPGRKYRLSTRIGVTIPAGVTFRMYMGVQCYDAAGPVGSNVGFRYILLDAADYTTSGWRNAAVEFDTTGLNAGTTSIRLVAWNNYYGVSGSVGIDYFLLEDITDSAGARDWANAAATSASSASASAGAAGQSATSASQSANTATTQNGQAQQAASAAQSSAAAASASEASAASSAVLSATFSADALTLNSNFANYPTATGVPPNWTVGAGTSGSDFLRIAGRVSPYAMRMIGRANANIYAFQGRASSPKLIANSQWMVIEAEITLNAGSLSGAGVLFRPYNSARNAYHDITLNFRTDPANTDTVIGNGAVGQTYTYSKMVQVTLPDAAGFDIFPMAHWEPLGSIATDNDVTFHKVSVRPATIQEIVARKAQMDAATNAASISSLSSAMATADTALGQRIDSVVATANGLSASVQQVSAAVAGKQDKTGAAWSVTAQTPQGRARIRAIADGYGSAVELDADAIALGSMQTFLVESGRATLKGDLYIVRGLLVQLSNNHMIVTGNGFGVNNEFMSWSGPPMAISQCSKANAKTYQTVSGDVYTSGTIIAGVLRNAVQTSSLSLGASISTGVVGSNGGSRVVVVSYEWSDTYQFTGAAPATSGNTYATVILSRNGVDVATLNATGTYNRTQGWSAQEPGGYSSYIAGSTTYTDNTGGSSVSYAARLVTRYAGEGGPGPQVQTNTQRISIVQQE